MRTWVTVAAAAVVASGCGGEDDSSMEGRDGAMMDRDSTMMEPGDDPMMDRDDGMMMGDQALGGGARTEQLARVRLDEPPERDVAWIASEVRLAPGEQVEHRHPVAFTLARDGMHLVTQGDGMRSRLARGEAAALEAGAEHVHAATDGEASTFWEFVLAPPGTELPAAPDARTIFETEPLRGIPDEAAAALVDVRLPMMGDATSVHNHPGPETIYVLDGSFEYQTGEHGTTRVMPGDERTTAAGVAVQKRNDRPGSARFLSLFLVDPDEPFASDAEFDTSP